MVYLLRGRLVLQAYVLAELELDRREYRQSDRGAKARAKLGFELGKAGVASLGIWYPGVIDRGVASAVGWSATRLSVLGGAAVTAAAPWAATYAIGATVGTAIAGTIWGDEGAQTAMGFYSGGLLPGTEAPDLSDYQYIFKPTAPGGPVSLYDVGKKGIDNTLRALSWIWSQRPAVHFHQGNPYLI